MLLCTDGCVEAGGLTLDRGGAAWVAAAAPPVVVEGRGTVFCAGLGVGA